jgi:hypothetical protein
MFGKCRGSGVMAEFNFVMVWFKYGRTCFCVCAAKWVYCSDKMRVGGVLVCIGHYVKL